MDNELITVPTLERVFTEKLYVDKQIITRDNEITPVNIILPTDETWTWQSDTPNKFEVQFYDDKDLVTGNYKLSLMKEYEYILDLNKKLNNILEGYLLVPVELNGENKMYLRDISIPINLDLNLFGTNTLELSSWGFTASEYFQEDLNLKTNVTIRYNLNSYFSDEVLWKDLKLWYKDLTAANSNTNYSELADLNSLGGLVTVKLTARHIYQVRISYEVSYPDSTTTEQKSIDNLWILSTQLFNDCFNIGENYINNYCSPKKGKEQETFNKLTEVKLKLKVNISPVGNDVLKNNGDPSYYIKFNGGNFNIKVTDKIISNYNIVSKLIIIDGDENLYPIGLLNTNSANVNAELNTTINIGEGNNIIPVKIYKSNLNGSNLEITTTFDNVFIGGVLQLSKEFNNLFVSMQEYFYQIRNSLWKVGMFIGKNENDSDPYEWHVKTIIGDETEIITNKYEEGDTRGFKIEYFDGNFIIGSVSPSEPEYLENYYSYNKEINDSTLHNNDSNNGINSAPVFVRCSSNLSSTGVTHVGIVPNKLFSNNYLLDSPDGINELTTLLFGEKKCIVHIPKMTKTYYIPDLSNPASLKYLDKKEIDYEIKFNVIENSVPGNIINNIDDNLNLNLKFTRSESIGEGIVPINKIISSSPDFIEGLENKRNVTEYIDIVNNKLITLPNSAEVDSSNIYTYNNNEYETVNNVKAVYNNITDSRVLVFKQDANKQYYITRGNISDDDDDDIYVELSKNNINPIILPT